jgi:hypothetical protein
VLTIALRDLRKPRRLAQDVACLSISKASEGDVHVLACEQCEAVVGLGSVVRVDQRPEGDLATRAEARDELTYPPAPGGSGPACGKGRVAH